MLMPIHHKLVGLAVRPTQRTMSWLRTYGRRNGDVVRAAVRDRRLAATAPRGWAEHRDALRHFFGHHDGHCFNVSGHDWVQLTETQVTGGLVRFLNDRTPAIRHMRVAALFQACGAGEVLADDLTEGHALAEYPIAARGRLDIVAVARAASVPDRLLVVEAKLAHELSPGQLKRYEAGSVEVARAEELVAPAITRIVVAPRRTSVMQVQLKQRLGWSVLSWGELIRRLERQLPAEADDDDFRRFRRTGWERCAAICAITTSPRPSTP